MTVGLVKYFLTRRYVVAANNNSGCFGRIFNLIPVAARPMSGGVADNSYFTRRIATNDGF